MRTPVQKRSEQVFCCKIKKNLPRCVADVNENKILEKIMTLPSKTKEIRLPKSRFVVDFYIGISRSFGVNFEWYKLRPRHGSTYSLHLPFVVLSVDVFDTVKLKEIFDDLARFSEMQMRLDDEKKENLAKENRAIDELHREDSPQSVSDLFNKKEIND